MEEWELEEAEDSEWMEEVLDEDSHIRFHHPIIIMDGVEIMGGVEIITMKFQCITQHIIRAPIKLFYYLIL